MAILSWKRGVFVLNKEDYIALIEVADAIEQLDRGFEKWLGVGHVGGNLDGLYGVLLRNANDKMLQINILLIVICIMKFCQTILLG